MNHLSRKVCRPRSRAVSLWTAQNAIALAVFLGCIAIAWWVVAQSGLDLSQPAAMMGSLSQLGWRGVVLYIGFLVVAIVIGPIPSTPITIAAGAIWGGVPAGIYGSIGIFLGSMTAYFLGRTLGRSIVRLLIGKVLYLSNHRGEVYLGWLVFIAHLLPVMPYELFSYGAGISGMSLPLFSVACLLGAVPCAFLLTHIGSALTVSWPLALMLMVVFIATVGSVSWGVKQHNWFGLRDVIRLE
jgi:uncharacterized membrane protein YdjX (TVP38/TMEM64 family)